MNELRWILVGFGIVLLAAIYLWGRRLRPGTGSQVRRPVIEPEHVEPDYRELDVPSYLRNPEIRTDPDAATDDDENRTEPLDDADDAPPALLSAREPSVAHGIEVPDREEGDDISDAVDAPAPESDDRVTQTPAYRRQRMEPRLGPLISEARVPAYPPEAKPPAPKRAEPKLGDAHAAESAAREPRGNDVRDQQGDRSGSRKRIFAIRLVSPAGRRYAGDALLAKLQEEGLQHGRYGIFHYLDASGESVFSVASMVEPGSFDLDAMPTAEFPGLTLFALLPGPKPGADAIMAMIACSDRLQRTLGGALQDENGMPLQQARLETMWSEATALDAGSPQDSSSTVAT